MLPVSMPRLSRTLPSTHPKAAAFLRIPWHPNVFFCSLTDVALRTIRATTVELTSNPKEIGGPELRRHCLVDYLVKMAVIIHNFIFPT